MFTCGPVAIINAIKWSGFKVSHDKLIKSWRQVCRCRPKRGTSDVHLHAAICKAANICNWQVRYKSPCYIGEIEQHLEAGGSVIMKHVCVEGKGRDGDAWGHISFLPAISAGHGYFYAVNDNIYSERGSALSLISRKQFKSRILRFQGETIGWFILQHSAN